MWPPLRVAWHRSHPGWGEGQPAAVVANLLPTGMAGVVVAKKQIHSRRREAGVSPPEKGVTGTEKEKNIRTGYIGMSSETQKLMTFNTHINTHTS